MVGVVEVLDILDYIFFICNKGCFVKGLYRVGMGSGY